MNTMEAYVHQFNAEQKSCLARVAALKADMRGDMADMIRIRANIYGIVASVCRMAENHDPADQAAYVRAKLDAIPQAWVESLTAAKNNGDDAKIKSEKLKLAVMSEIRGILAPALNSD